MHKHPILPPLRRLCNGMVTRCIQTSLRTITPNLTFPHRFNIYILDYCLKRGYEHTARKLREEAHLPEEEKPPIDAKQGLLFE